MLSALHLAEAWAMLGHAEGSSTLTLRAIACGILAASGLAIGAQRVWPAVVRERHTTTHAVAPDAVLRAKGLQPHLAALGDTRTATFTGSLAAIGAALVVAGAALYGVSPLGEPPGLAGGGLMRVDVQSGAESAWVDVGGIRVKQHLAGNKVELIDARLGVLDGTEDSGARARLRITNIPSGEVQEVEVVSGQTTEVGGLTYNLVALEPTPIPAGVRVHITDSTDKRGFDATLRLNQLFKDPAGPGQFVVQSIEPNFMDILGARAAGLVTEDSAEAPFQIWEKDAGYDELHRRGRYHIAFKDVVAGQQAVIGVAEPPPFDLVAVALGLLLVGIGLLLASPQRSYLALTLDEEPMVAISSFNDAAGAVAEAFARQEAP